MHTTPSIRRRFQSLAEYEAEGQAVTAAALAELAATPEFQERSDVMVMRQKELDMVRVEQQSEHHQRHIVVTLAALAAAAISALLCVTLLLMPHVPTVGWSRTVIQQQARPSNALAEQTQHSASAQEFSVLVQQLGAGQSEMASHLPSEPQQAGEHTQQYNEAAPTNHMHVQNFSNRPVSARHQQLQCAPQSMLQISTMPLCCSATATPNACELWQDNYALNGMATRSNKKGMLQHEVHRESFVLDDSEVAAPAQPPVAQAAPSSRTVQVFAAPAARVAGLKAQADEHVLANTHSIAVAAMCVRPLARLSRYIKAAQQHTAPLVTAAAQLVLDPPVVLHPVLRLSAAVFLAVLCGIVLTQCWPAAWTISDDATCNHEASSSAADAINDVSVKVTPDGNAAHYAPDELPGFYTSAFTSEAGTQVADVLQSGLTPPQLPEAHNGASTDSSAESASAAATQIDALRQADDEVAALTQDTAAQKVPADMTALQAAKLQRTELMSKVTGIQAQFTAYKQALQGVQQQRADLESKHEAEVAHYTDLLGSARNDAAAAHEQVQQLREQLQQLQAGLSEQQEQDAQLRAHVEQASQAGGGTEAVLRDVEQAHHESQKALEQVMAELDAARAELQAAEESRTSAHADFADLQERLQDSEATQVELSESLLLLQERMQQRSDRATSMSPAAFAPVSPEASSAERDSNDAANLLTKLIEHIKPLFPAVYDADLDIALEGEEGEQELLNVLKQAAFQLWSTDSAEKALANAMATLVIAEDPARVEVDASSVSETLEEPFNAMVSHWRSVWQQLLEAQRSRDAHAADLQATQAALQNVEQELDMLRSRAADEQSRQAAMQRVSDSPSPSTPTPLPRSGLATTPYANPEQELLAAQTPAQKRAWLERYVGLLRACEAGHHVAAELQVRDGEHVDVKLAVMPSAALALQRLQQSLQCSQHTGDYLSAVMRGHLQSIGSATQPRLALPSVPALPGVSGTSAECAELTCVSSQLLLQHEGTRAEQSQVVTEPSSEMQQYCRNMLSMIDSVRDAAHQATPGVEVSGLTSMSGTPLSPMSLQTATTLRVERLLSDVWSLLPSEMQPGAQSSASVLAGADAMVQSSFDDYEAQLDATLASSEELRALVRFCDDTLDDARIRVSTPSTSAASSDESPRGSAAGGEVGDARAQVSGTHGRLEAHGKFWSQKVHLRALQRSARDVDEQRSKLKRFAAANYFLQAQERQLLMALEAMDEATSRHHAETKRVHEVYVQLTREREHLLQELTNFSTIGCDDSCNLATSDEVLELKAQYDEVEAQVQALRQQGITMTMSQEQILKTQKLQQLEDMLTQLMEQRTAHSEHLHGAADTAASFVRSVLQEAQELLRFFALHGYAAPDGINATLTKMARGAQRSLVPAGAADSELQLVSPERSQTDARTVQWVVNSSSHGYTSTTDASTGQHLGQSPVSGIVPSPAQDGAAGVAAHLDAEDPAAHRWSGICGPAHVQTSVRDLQLPSPLAGSDTDAAAGGIPAALPRSKVASSGRTQHAAPSVSSSTAAASPGVTFMAPAAAGAATPLFGQASRYRTPHASASEPDSASMAAETRFATPSGQEPTPRSFSKLPDGSTLEVEAAQLLPGQRLDVSPLTGLPLDPRPLPLASANGQSGTPQGSGSSATHADALSHGAACAGSAGSAAATSRLPKAPPRGAESWRPTDTGPATRDSSNALGQVAPASEGTPSQALQATTPLPDQIGATAAHSTAVHTFSRAAPQSTLVRHHQHEPTPPARLAASTPLPTGPMPSQPPLHAGAGQHPAAADAAPAMPPTARTSLIRTSPAATASVSSAGVSGPLPQPMQAESPYIAPRRATPRSDQSLARQSMSPSEWHDNILAAELFAEQSLQLEGQDSTALLSGLAEVASIEREAGAVRSAGSAALGGDSSGIFADVLRQYDGELDLSALLDVDGDAVVLGDSFRSDARQEQGAQAAVAQAVAGKAHARGRLQPGSPDENACHNGH